MRTLIKYCLGLLGSIFLGFCWLVRPVVRIRIGLLLTQRIGQLIPTVEYWLRTEAAAPKTAGLTGKGPREVRLFAATPHNAANMHALRMIARRIPILISRLAASIYHATEARHPDSPVWINISRKGWDDYDLWKQTKPQAALQFTHGERKSGEALLQSMGIPAGAPFICFAARDPAYLNSHANPAKQFPPAAPDNWSYQDYRDNDINNYLKMAEHFADQGLWVLRMGAVVERRVQSQKPRIIDYASDHRSDFGDIFLMGNCKFYIGDTAGVFYLSLIFDVPMALANYVPLVNSGRGTIPVYIPKKFRRNGDNDLLPYRKVIEMGADKFTMSDQYAQLGLELIENTPDEILELARELSERVDGVWRPEPEDELLQQRYRDLFPDGHVVHRSPAWVAAAFLRNNRELFE